LAGHGSPARVPWKVPHGRPHPRTIPVLPILVRCVDQRRRAAAAPFAAARQTPSGQSFTAGGESCAVCPPARSATTKIWAEDRISGSGGTCAAKWPQWLGARSWRDRFGPERSHTGGGHAVVPWHCRRWLGSVDITALRHPRPSRPEGDGCQEPRHDRIGGNSLVARRTGADRRHASQTLSLKSH